MNITLDDMAVMLKTSPGTIITIKKKLGFPKGYKTTDKDLPIIKAEVKKIQKGCRRRNPNKEDYYLKAMAILKRDGIITAQELNSIFKVCNVSIVETFFENKDTPLYHEWIDVPKKKKYTVGKIKIFKLNNLYKNNVKKIEPEVKSVPNGLLRVLRDKPTYKNYNNAYNGNPNSMFKGAR